VRSEPFGSGVLSSDSSGKVSCCEPTTDQHTVGLGKARSLRFGFVFLEKTHMRHFPECINGALT
jgi:hypothetical protein